MESGGEQASAGQQQQFVNPGGPATSSFLQFPPSVFVPLDMPGILTHGERLQSAQTTPTSQLEARKKIIEHQIEVPFPASYMRFLAFSFATQLSNT